MTDHAEPLAGFTPWQREMWAIAGVEDRPPTRWAGQTLEQARNFAVLDSQQVCYFDGVEPPPEELIYAEVDRVMAKHGITRTPTERPASTAKHIRDDLTFAEKHPDWDYERYGRPGAT